MLNLSTHVSNQAHAAHVNASGANTFNGTGDEQHHKRFAHSKNYNNY